MNGELTVRIDPEHIALDAGGTGQVLIQLENRSTVVDEYSIEVLGEAAAWTTPERSRAAVMPNGSAAVQVSIRPPRAPFPPAGSVPIGFRVRSSVDPSLLVVEECHVELRPFVEIEAELTPRTARGRFSATHRLQVANQGNAQVDVSVRAEVQQGDCKIEIPPGGLQIEAGDRKTAKIKVRPSRSVWQGGQEMHSYRLNLLPQGGKPVAIDGMMRQLPIARIPTALLVAAALVLGGAYAVYGRGPNPLQSPWKAPWIGTIDVQPSPGALPSQSIAPTTGSPPPPATFGPPPIYGACVPGAPTGVKATAGNGQTTVSWAAPPGTCAVTSYTVTGSPGTITTSAGGSALTVVVLNLTNCTLYAFVVDATGPGGPGPASAPSSPVMPGAGPPGPPTGVTATAGDAIASLTWQAPASNGCAPITSYTVKGAPGAVSIAMTPTGGSASLTSLVDGTTYTFAVAAVNTAGAGPSAASNAVTPHCTAVNSLQLSTTPYSVYWQANGSCSPYSGTVVATWTPFIGFKSSKTYPFSASGPNASGRVAYCAPIGTASATFTVTLQDSQGHSIVGVTAYNGAFVVGC